MGVSLGSYLDPTIKIVVVLVPLLWKTITTWHFHRKSGKRIRYVIWKDEKASALHPRTWRLIRFFLRKPDQPATNSTASEIRTAQLFIWNAGIEDIAESDVFHDRPVYIDLANGEIASFRVLLESDDLIFQDWKLAERASWHPLIQYSERVIAAKLQHWPPGAGAVVEIRYRAPSIKLAKFLVGGPIRNLRERKFLGRLWRIDLRDAAQLAKKLPTATFMSWASGLFFVFFLIFSLVHFPEWTIGTWHYWVSVAVLLVFEGLFFSWNDKRVQISKKICPSLRYWLPGRL